VRKGGSNHYEEQRRKKLGILGRGEKASKKGEKDPSREERGPDLRGEVEDLPDRDGRGCYQWKDLNAAKRSERKENTSGEREKRGGLK